MNMAAMGGLVPRLRLTTAVPDVRGVSVHTRESRTDVGTVPSCGSMRETQSTVRSEGMTR
jgi:hypothetical protein